MRTKQYWVFSDAEKRAVLSLLAKGRTAQQTNDKFPLITFDEYWRLFSDEEISVMKKYLEIDPGAIDYKLPYLGLVDTPRDIVALPDQEYTVDNTTQLLTCQYLPKRAYEAYSKLNKAINAQTGNELLVRHGYRSPARQLFMFFDILQRKYDYDFNMTLSRVCFPAYSEHAFPNFQAVDFMTRGGISGEDFEHTDEYRWLCIHAANFGFTESYSKNNVFNMMYEPWHWRINANQ